MGNSASLGQGRMETNNQRDMEVDETKDGRPPMEVQVAEEKPMEDQSNQNPPHTYNSSVYIISVNDYCKFNNVHELHNTIGLAPHAESSRNPVYFVCLVLPRPLPR